MATRRTWRTFHRYLDTVGNGSGEKNAIGNYSEEPIRFQFRPEFAVEVNRLIVTIADRGQFDAGFYGNNIELADGIRVVLARADSAEGHVDLLDGEPVRSNYQWARTCFDVNYIDFGLGVNAVVVRWTFDKAGDGIQVDGLSGDGFCVDLSDDFSGLEEHRFMIQGEYL